MLRGKGREEDLAWLGTRLGQKYSFTWIGNLDVKSVSHEDISHRKVTMNKSMICQKFLRDRI